MSVEAKDKEELDVTSDKDKETTKQAWIAIAAQEVEKETYDRDKDLEEAMQLKEDSL